MSQKENAPDAVARAKPCRRRKEARPQELLEAAMALFIERGYAATRLEEVAQRAGVVKGTIYRYYADKLALFTAVVEQVVAPLIEDDRVWLAAGIVPTEPPFERLWQLLRRWGGRLFHTPLGGIAKLVMAEAHNFPEMATVYHQRVIEPAMALVEALIAEGQAAGSFAPGLVSPLARVVVAPLLQRTMWLSSFAAVCPNAAETFDEESFWHAYRQLLQWGIAGGWDGQPAR